MSLLEYQRRDVTRPEVRAAAVYLLVWGIVDFVLAGAAGVFVVICALATLLSGFAIVFNAMLLGFIPAILAAALFAYGKACFRLRSTILVEIMEGVNEAQRLTIVPLVMVGSATMMPILISAFGILVGDSEAIVWGVGITVAMLSVEVLLIWTYRVLGRAGKTALQRPGE